MLQDMHSKNIGTGKEIDMAWITTKEGHHINTEWFEKDRQIAQNKKEADERNKPVLEPGKPTKNSEDAFKYIYRNARKFAKEGDRIDTIAGGFNYKGDDTPVLSTQALKGIQSMINSERKDLKLDFELGVLSKSEVDVRHKALDIVQRTLNSKVRGN